MATKLRSIRLDKKISDWVDKKRIEENRTFNNMVETIIIRYKKSQEQNK